MTNLLTLKEKINKILEYCEYTKQLAIDAGHKVRFRVEIENTVGELETEQQDVQNVYINECTVIIRPFFYSRLLTVALGAKQYSQNHNCLSSVKVYIKTYNSECKLIDEEPIDDYEICFENGIEVR